MTWSWTRTLFMKCMQKLLEQNTVPPDGFRYLQPETRTTVKGGDYFDLFAKVKAHRLANNIPLGPNWQAEVEDQLCQMLPPGFCKEQQPDPSRTVINVTTRMNWADVEHATSVFVGWAVAGAPTVDQAEADRRANICAGCYFNVGGDFGCRTCGGVVNMIKRAVGARRTAAGAFLKTCAVCKCFNAVQVWFPVEQLARGTTPQQMTMFPHFCWKGQALLELQKEAVNV